MPYTPYESNVPVISDTGAKVIADTRHNLEALRDAVVAGGLSGWSMAVQTPSLEWPDVFTWSSGTLRIMEVITYSYAGVTTGRVLNIEYRFSGNSGGAWDVIGTRTLNYDVNGRLTGSTWG